MGPSANPLDNFRSALQAAENLLNVPPLWEYKRSVHVMRYCPQALALYLAELKLALQSRESEKVPTETKTTPNASSSTGGISGHDDDGGAPAGVGGAEATFSSPDSAAIHIITTVHGAQGLPMPCNPYAAVRVGSGPWSTTPVRENNPEPVFNHHSVALNDVDAETRVHLKLLSLNTMGDDEAMGECRLTLPLRLWPETRAVGT